MTGKVRGNIKDKSFKVTVNWHYTEEVSPAFRRLMALLLQAPPKEERHK
jgi:hypothetical protein